MALGQGDEYPQYSHLKRGGPLVGTAMGEMGPSGVAGRVAIDAELRAESCEKNKRLGMMGTLVTDGSGGLTDSELEIIITVEDILI